MNTLILKIYENTKDKHSLEQSIKALDFENEKHFEIEITANNDFDKTKSSIFPDGFLYFPFIISYYKEEKKHDEPDIQNTIKILNKLWSNGIPAIAASDYEERLPERGGYNSKNVPW